MDSEKIEISNPEGIQYCIPLSFIGKETRVGDKVVSYQLLRLKKTGLFTVDELYPVARLIQELDPKCIIDWTATFQLLENDTTAHVRKKLKALQLAA